MWKSNSYNTFLLQHPYRGSASQTELCWPEHELVVDLLQEARTDWVSSHLRQLRQQVVQRPGEMGGQEHLSRYASCALRM